MVAFIVRRLLYLVLVLFGVTLLVFIAMRLTGDPVQLLLQQGNPTPQDIANLRHAMHLDLPLYQQYFAFVSHAVRGDFGNSLRYRDSAFSEIMLRMPPRLSWRGRVSRGTRSGDSNRCPVAVRRGGPVDFISRFLSLIGISFPNFWLGLMLILLFGVWLHWLPVSGRGHGFVGGLKALVLPATTLGVAYVATLSRLLRSSMLEELHTDYVRTARAKGLRERPVLIRHALRNALIPFITVAGLQIGFLLGGAVIVEVVFSWPRVGRLVVDSINNRDYPVVQAAVTLLASILILANLIVDLLYAVLDPRIHYS